RQLELAAASNGFSVAPIFGVEQQLVDRVVVKAERPAEVVALLHAVHRLRGPRLVVFRRERLAPEAVELIAVVHDGIGPAVMPRDARHLPEAGRVADPVALLLSELVLVELPDATARFEHRAGILTGQLRTAILRLAGVRRRPDVHVHRPLAVEGNALVVM